MHPSFLYESLFLALCAWALFAIARRGRAPAQWMIEGDVFKLFLLAYAIFRFFVEFVRGSPLMGFGLTGSQLIVLPSAIVLSLYFVRRQRNHAVASLATVTS
jgi:prolipoprotein diacylglyceryltransferase